MTLNAPPLTLIGSRRPAGPPPPSRTRARRAGAVAGAFALGALTEYFLDPRGGRRRRHTARDRTLATLRRTERRAALRARRAESRAVGGVRRTMAGRRTREPLDDATLAHKVESELFRRVPKGHIDINCENGVVFLRGVVERLDDIERIEAAALAIAGVTDVENLLHLPGTPAPQSRPRLVREREASSSPASGR
jgi:osmotically-inducible protein OsmY